MGNLPLIPKTLRLVLALALFVLDGSPSEAALDEPSAHREALARFALGHDGDPKRGALLFAEPDGAACLRCHRVKGQGGVIGPDLSDVGAKFRRADLVEAVLEPSRQVVEGYRPVRTWRWSTAGCSPAWSGASRPKG